MFMGTVSTFSLSLYPFERDDQRFTHRASFIDTPFNTNHLLIERACDTTMQLIVHRNMFTRVSMHAIAHNLCALLNLCTMHGVLCRLLYLFGWPIYFGPQCSLIK